MALWWVYYCSSCTILFVHQPFRRTVRCGISLIEFTNTDVSCGFVSRCMLLLLFFFSLLFRKSVHVHDRMNVSRVRFCVFTFLIVFPTCRCFDLDSGSVLSRTSALAIAVRQWNFVTPSSLSVILCFLCTFFSIFLREMHARTTFACCSSERSFVCLLTVSFVFPYYENQKLVDSVKTIKDFSDCVIFSFFFFFNFPNLAPLEINRRGNTTIGPLLLFSDRQSFVPHFINDQLLWKK